MTGLAIAVHRFRFGDETFESDVEPIGPAVDVQPGPVDCTIRRRRRRPDERTITWLPRGIDWPDDYRVGRRRTGDYELWLGEDAVLTISVDGSHVGYWVSRGVDHGYISHLVLDHALPSRLGVLGRSAFHGTAVAVGSGALAFLGATGAGKSTMAAGFVAAGHDLLADDCLLLDPRDDGFWVVPTYPATRLFEDSLVHLFGAGAADGGTLSELYPKHLVDAPMQSAKPLHLSALVFLDRGDVTEPALVDVAPLAALGRLLGQTWYMESRGAALAALVDRVGGVVDSVRVVELSVPADFGALAACRELLIDRLAPHG